MLVTYLLENVFTRCYNEMKQQRSFIKTLNNLKTKVDKLDAGELKTVSVDLKKLSDVLDIKSC